MKKVSKMDKSKKDYIFVTHYTRNSITYYIKKASKCLDTFNSLFVFKRCIPNAHNKQFQCPFVFV